MLFYGATSYAVFTPVHGVWDNENNNVTYLIINFRINAIGTPAHSIEVSREMLTILMAFAK